MSKDKIHKWLSSDHNLSDEELKILEDKAPYSQNVQYLKHQQAGQSNFDLMRYNWFAKTEESNDPNSDVVILSTIDLKSSKQKEVKKPKSNRKKPKQKAVVQEDVKEDVKEKEVHVQEAEIKHPIEPIELTIDQPLESQEQKELTKAKPVKSVKKKRKKKPSGAQVVKEVELDDFTIWLNSISSTDSGVLIKKTVKKKKAKKKKKDKINHIIEDSVMPKDEIATESLAKLYVNQGYYDKAIDIYKTLSLKNPEKSSFFAAEIEKIKDKI